MSRLIASNLKNGHFSTKKWLKKVTLDGQIPDSFYMDPMLPTLRRIKLIGICLLIRIKEIKVNQFLHNLKNGYFPTKIAIKRPWMAKILIVLNASHSVMLKEYPVDWNALVL